jgi:hypothetical protein
MLNRKLTKTALMRRFQRKEPSIYCISNFFTLKKGKEIAYLFLNKCTAVQICFEISSVSV